ncbi:unnamed protein product [Owenia fusiformis]|uniref:Uncharacterized protein n=1 Tax=Owenia fusiformis TaxID=6347 RepID=A0A8J1TCZ0_OWEFU|nr:unnamed protein product [Owenia fusiformis]
MAASTESGGFKVSEGVVVQASPVNIAAPFCQHADINVPLLGDKGSKIDNDSVDVQYLKLDLDSNVYKLIPQSDDINCLRSNPLIVMCLVGFAEHRPISLYPDLLWHYIVKGVAFHVHSNPDELRDIFVDHAGKRDVVIKRLETDREETNVDKWRNLIREFAAQIQPSLKETSQIVYGDRFSTTTDVITDVSRIALMDTAQRCFRFKSVIICGIPSVALLGNVDDWRQLKRQTEALIKLFEPFDDELNLNWWKRAILSVLEKLIKCYECPDEKANADWMARIFKSNREFYGGDKNVTGWINVFFPYVGYNTLEPNEMAKVAYCVNRSRSTYVDSDDDLDTFDIVENTANVELPDNVAYDNKTGDTDSDEDSVLSYATDHESFQQTALYPKAISTAPFTLNEMGTLTKMAFNGGPCCVTEQTVQIEGGPTQIGTLHVPFGWSVVTDKPSKHG